MLHEVYSDCFELKSYLLIYSDSECCTDWCHWRHSPHKHLTVWTPTFLFYGSNHINLGIHFCFWNSIGALLGFFHVLTVFLPALNCFWKAFWRRDRKERKMPIRGEEFCVSQLGKGSHVRWVNNLNMGHRASESALLLTNVLITLTLPLFPNCDRKWSFSSISC